MDATDYLKRIPLFSELAAPEIMDVLRMARTVSFARGDVLCRVGDPADCLYVIEQGEVSVSVTGRQSKKVEIARLGAGEVIGELALVDGQPRSADVTVTKAMEGYRIDRAAFDQMRLDLHPAAFKMLKQISLSVSWRLREINQAVAGAMTHVRPRVQTTEARMSGEFGVRKLSIPPPRSAATATATATARDDGDGPGFWRGVINRISLGPKE